MYEWSPISRGLGSDHTHAHAHTHTFPPHEICILVLIMPHTLKRTHSSGKCGGFSFHAASQGRAEPALTVGGGFTLHQPLCDNNIDESNRGEMQSYGNTQGGKLILWGQMVLVDGLWLLTEADSEWWAQHKDIVCWSNLTFTDP